MRIYFNAMKFNINFAAISLTVIALIGCATPQSKRPDVDPVSAKLEADKQREIVVADYVDSNNRLQSIGSKVLTSGTELCGQNVGPFFGVSTWNQDFFEKEWLSVGKKKYGVTEKLQISNIVINSPSDIGG
jgi:hypothetical protein